MKKNYIKLNVNDKHLSLGNLCRIIKGVSKNKSTAIQTEIFCTLFNINNINDTMVNNYCVGIRSINNKYKQIYMTYQIEYQKDKLTMISVILNLISIMDNRIYCNIPNPIDFINNNNLLKIVVNKLYNISKNDTFVTNNFSNQIYDFINDGNYYDAFVNMLFFIILEKKQPIYESDIKMQIIERILNNDNISAIDLEEYLDLKLNEGINFNYHLKRLGDKGNFYACYELGMSEFKGDYAGKSRYINAFNYFKVASTHNHALSYYMMSIMYFKGYIGNNTKNDLKIAYSYLEKAYDLGATAAINTLGLMYLNGSYPLKRDINKAIELFKEACTKNYAYAYNNLGKIYEKMNNKSYINYYIKSADLGESWACNKVGEYYRIMNNEKKAYEYYKKALILPYNNICFYAYYNLAKYYYLNGNPYSNTEKDISKAIEYFDIAGNNGIIEAKLELLYYSVKKYLNNKNKNNMDCIIKLKNSIENDIKYDNYIKDIIDKNLYNIKKKSSINLNMLEY